MNDLLIELNREGGRRSISLLDEKLFKQDYLLCFVWGKLLKLQHQASYYKQEAYFQFTYEFLEKQFNLSNYKVRQYVDTLKDLGLLEIKHIGTPSRIYYKIDSKQYNTLLEELFITRDSSINSTDVDSTVRTDVDFNSLNITSESKSKDLKSKEVSSKEDTAQSSKGEDSVTSSFKQRIEARKAQASQTLSKEEVSVKPVLNRKLNTTLSKEEVVDPVKEQENKPKLVRQKPSIFPSKDVEILFNYWGTFAEFTKHKVAPGTSTFDTAINYLQNACSKYPADKIKDAIYDYACLINRPNTLLAKVAPGHVVASLADFFKFSSNLKDRIRDNSKGRINVLEDMNGWFEECLKGWDHLIERFDKAPICPEDKYPTVTLELEKQYKANVNPNQISTKEHIMFIKAAQRLVDWHYNMNGKINFSSCPIEKESVTKFAHRMIDAILDNIDDPSIVTVAWLVTDNQFNIRLTGYLKKLGMLAGTHQSSSNDVMTEESKKQRKAEIDELNIQGQAEGLLIHESDNTEETKHHMYKALQDKYKPLRAAIFAKYGGVA